MGIKSYRDLDVWQRAMDLAELSYRFTGTMPREERFGLAAQIKRSAASVPANIAEGYGRESTGSYVHFLKTARGSLKELETHVILAERVALLQSENAANVLERSEVVGKMLNSLIRSLESRSI